MRNYTVKNGKLIYSEDEIENENSEFDAFLKSGNAKGIFRITSFSRLKFDTFSLNIAKRPEKSGVVVVEKHKYFLTDGFYDVCSFLKLVDHGVAYPLFLKPIPQHFNESSTRSCILQMVL